MKRQIWLDDFDHFTLLDLVKHASDGLYNLLIGKDFQPSGDILVIYMLDNEYYFTVFKRLEDLTKAIDEGFDIPKYIVDLKTDKLIDFEVTKTTSIKYYRKYN